VVEPQAEQETNRVLPPLPAQALRPPGRLWDPLRKREVTHTPEEEVRQRLIFHLLVDRGFPPALMAVERAIQLGPRQRRFDLVVFNRTGQPLLLAECKAPHEPINDSVALQIAHYNTVLQAPWLLLTNGNGMLVANLLTLPLRWNSAVPHFDELV
jgi:hypothetical protein